MRRIQNFIFILLIFLLFGCKTENLIATSFNTERISIDETISPHPEIENFVQPYYNHINKTLDSILAYNPTDLDKSDGELNTAIGNLMADIVMHQANPVFRSRTGNDIDLVLLNHGGIRSTMGIGPVSSRTAYKLMPFENEVVVVELKGEKILELLSYLENNRTAHPISGLQITMDRNYKITNATINGKPVVPNETYFVATSDYLQLGGDNMVFLKDPEKLHRLDYKIRNTLIDYFGVVDTIKATRDNRYIKVD